MMETSIDRRLRKLGELCAAYGLKDVAKRALVSPAALDQILKRTPLPERKDGTRGVRSLGDASARLIEQGFGLEAGWFDSEATPALWDQDTMIFATNYQKMSIQDRQKLKLLYQLLTDS